MNHKLKKTIVVLHLSAIFYFLIGIVFLVSLFFLGSPAEKEMDNFDQAVVMAAGIGTLLISIATGIFVEITINSLKKNRYWAWVAGLIICGLYLPSIFVVLGIIGLIGLLDKDVRKDFKS